MAGLVGLSLSYAIPITGLLNGLLTSTAETEQEMVAVERIAEFSDIQAEVCSPAQNSHLQCKNWRQSQVGVSILIRTYDTSYGGRYYVWH